MKVSTIKSTWLPKGGFRLDCSPYLGGAIETEILLEALSVRKDSLGSVTSAIFNGPQFIRNYVDDPDCGVPFMTGSTMLLADLSNLPLLSKRDAHSSKLSYLQLQPGMTLISCSGSIGKMTYARPEMSDIWASQDILKVVADPEKVLPGYLYAFLSSKFGVPLITSGTYGAIIQHLEPAHITGLSVPRFGDKLEREIHDLVEDAARLRSEANKRIASVVATIDERISHVEIKKGRTWWEPVSSSSLHSRLDPGFYDPTAANIRSAIQESPCAKVSDFCSDISLPGIFKRIHVDDPSEAAPYYTGASLFCVSPEPKGYLSRATKLFDEVTIRRGMILVQAFGSEGGLNGRPVWVGKHFDGATTTHMLIRLFPEDIKFSGYLYAFLASKSGYRQMAALTYGGAIPHFDESGMASVLMPIFEKQQMLKMSERVEEAMDDRDRALDMETNAQLKLERAFQEFTNL